MKTPVSLIVLRKVRCNESTDIIGAYSRELGPVSFAIPSGAGKGASRRRALLMPMSMVEGIADMNPTRELGRLSQIRPLEVLHGIAANPVKSAISLLMADLLGAALRQGQADEAMWEYIAESLRVLDMLSPSSAANFHLVFIYGLGRMAGIEPDISTYTPGACFDLREGRFRPVLPLHGDVLTGREAEAVRLLSRLNYRNMGRVRLSRADRNAILDGMLHYMTIHYVPVDRLRSLDIVRELFV